MKRIISPSILATDFSNLYVDCQKLVDQGADWLHFDVMDGHFVPNITFGPQVIQSLKKKLPNVFFDCHFMISEPLKWVEIFKKAGADGFTFHYEAVKEDQLLDVINLIKKQDMKVGLALNPQTEIPDILQNIISELDLVLLMTVQPGFGGQKFQSQVMTKVQQVRQMNQQINIQVDGGVTKDNVQICVQNGANVIVSGTGIVNQTNPQEIIQFMKNVL